MTGRVLGLLLCATMLVSSSACGDDKCADALSCDDGSGPSGPSGSGAAGGGGNELCDAGESAFCQCPGGEQGTRVCADDGKSFEDCTLTSGDPCP